jgi:hypothetical protein
MNNAISVHQKRVDTVDQILRSSSNKPSEDLAEEIVAALDANAEFGFAFTRPNDSLIVNSVRETRDSVRIAGGEGNPVRVLVIPLSI